MKPKIFRFAWVGLFLAAQTAAAQTPASDLNVQEGLVARLRVSRPDQSPETAAAIYVGRDQNKAYFITAFHAVSASRSPDSNSVVSTVEFQLRNSRDPIVGQTLSTFDKDLDLAVVMIPLPQLPSGLPEVPMRDPTQAVRINIIGHPPAGSWSVWSGSIQNINGPQGDFHHFTTTTDSSLTGGYSGGPVLDFQGNLIGMHISTAGPTYARAIKAGVIVTALSSWNVPTGNLKPFDSIVDDLSDWARTYEEIKTNEMKLGQAGSDAFNAGNYDWAVRFLQRAKAVQTSRVWSANYPYLAGAFFLLGRTDDANRTLQEMLIEAQRPNVFLSHGPPLGMALANCDRVRAKLSAEDRKTLDRAVEKLVQIKQSAR